MSFERCFKCKEYDFINSHRCKPTWQVQEKDYHDEDYTIVYAYDEESAAEKYAEESDSKGDYTIISGSEATIRVRKDETSSWVTFVVSGESVPQYHARKE